MMSYYTCEPEWPCCSYDFSFKEKNPNFFALRVKQPLSDLIMPEYFSQEF